MPVPLWPVGQPCFWLATPILADVGELQLHNGARMKINTRNKRLADYRDRGGKLDWGKPFREPKRSRASFRSGGHLLCRFKGRGYWYRSPENGLAIYLGPTT